MPQISNTKCRSTGNVALIDEQLNRSLEEIAYENRKKLVEEARKEAEKIVEQARKDAQAYEEAQLNAARTRFEMEKSALLRTARQKANNILLKAKEDAIDEVFLEAENKLAALRKKPVYERVLAALIREALAEVEYESGWTHVDKRDKKLAANFLARNGNRKFKVKADLNCLGGVRVTSEDGRMIVDNRFESRLVRAKELFRKDPDLLLGGA